VSYLTTVQADSPLHYWRMADPGGNILHDIGSSPLHLVAALTTTGPYSGIAADGASIQSNGSAGPETFTALAQALPVTLECWFWLMFNTFAINQIVYWDGSGTGNEIQAWVDTAAALNVAVSGLGTQTYAGPVTQQAWHHFALTCTTAQLRVYLDGTLRISQNAVFPSPISKPIGWGCHPLVTDSHLIFVSEAALYSTALSAARVSAHFAAQEQSFAPVFFGTGNAANPSYPSSSNPPSVIADVLSSVRKTFTSP
jgi:Concanavalin A-like lectin/glucanases superfamily